MSDMDTQISHCDENVPVVIVGGSLIGLTTSLLLSWHGISSLLVERHSSTSIHPRAGSFNPRTMEILRSVGIEPAIRQIQPPSSGSIGLRVETLAGKELDAGWTPPLQNPFEAISPIQSATIGQDLLEPILRAHAERMGSTLCFGTELLSFEQDTEGVTVLLRERATGRERTVRACYVVAADGNRSPVRQSLEIGTHGYGTLAHWIYILFRADLREPLRGREIQLCFVNNAEVQGFLGYAGGDRWGLGTILHPEKDESPEHISDERCIELVRAAIGVPDLSVKLQNTLYWEAAARVADRFQHGRIFLAGDSAHVMSQMGALGANTGMQDAHNLAWKLALVLKGHAHPNLLTTYDVERRPIADMTVGQSLALYAWRLEGQIRQDLVPPVRDGVAVVIGYRYSSAAILTETEDDSENDPLLEDPYHPTGCPGTRAPHIVLEHDGKQLSTLDLFGRDFVLLIGSDGSIWESAAQNIANKLGLTLNTYHIGNEAAYIDSEGRFLDAYGLTRRGATLVRPDGFIGWRAKTSNEYAEHMLEQALRTLLGR